MDREGGMLPTGYDITNKVIFSRLGADALPRWRVEPVWPLQLLIFKWDKIASSRLPGSVRLLLHRVEGQDGNPVWPDEQHSLCGLPPQRREVTKYDLTWTVDRSVRGLDHRQKTFRGLELGLNLRAGQGKSASRIVLTQGV